MLSKENPCTELNMIRPRMSLFCHDFTYYNRTPFGFPSVAKYYFQGDLNVTQITLAIAEGIFGQVFKL
jgi:hypothetical protein